MAFHAEVTPSEAADRLAIRELFDAYAHCADRRDAERQEALFTADTPLRGLHGRRGRRADITVTIDGDRATARPRDR